MREGERRRWLLKRWVELCDRLCPEMPFESADAIFAVLQGLYACPRRHYHGLGHVRQCLLALDGLLEAGRGEFASVRPDLARLAVWTHDAIFESQRNDNEQRSAEVAKLICGRFGLSLDATQAVAGMVLATRHRAAGVGVPLSPEERLVADADLAVLAGDEASYDAYAAGVRREFAFLDDAEFASGRAGFVQRMLGRERIFQTETGHRLFESRARENLRREMSNRLMCV